jgi:glucose-6-phosphate isomerase
MKQYNDPAWQDSMRLRLDYNNMMTEIIGEQYGLTTGDLEAAAAAVENSRQQVDTKSGKGSDFLGFLDLPEKEQAEIDYIKETAGKLAANSDIFISLGIGGSYLGAKAVIETLYSPYYNQLSREKRNNRPRVFFEGNNLDSDSISYLFDLLPAGPPADLNQKFSVAVISKSGGTIETAVAFRLFQDKAREAYGKSHNEYIVAITDREKGKLKAIADHEKYPTFVIPDDVGGRFSVLTPVGLFPAAVAGIDIEEMLAGAKYMKGFCQNPGLFENPAYMYAALQHISYNRGRDISIMACWSKALENVGFWYDQLCAESLGKDGKGRAPVTIVDTRDLHSRGQEIQDGRQNTVVTNLFVEKAKHDIIFQEAESDPDALNYLAGKSLKSMLKCAMEGTNYAYAKDSRPTMNIIFPELNAFTLGQFFYMLEVSTVIEGYLMGVNPLNQPGVEAYKHFMFAGLGRDDMKEFKAEFEAREKPKENYII